MKKHWVITALSFSAALLITSTSFPQGVVGWTSGYVTTIGNINGNACIQINDRGSTSTNTTVLVDLTTNGGKAAFSTAITAMTTNQKVSIYSGSGPLMGGCDTGTTMLPMITLVMGSAF